MPLCFDALADQARVGLPEDIGKQKAERAISSLEAAIKQARELRTSARLKSIRNLRDKHIAHHLTQTREETKSGPVEQMKHGDEVPVLDVTISIVEVLNSWAAAEGVSGDRPQMCRGSMEGMHV
jgi:hypothetical protein